jgi:hypothetical protein
MAGRLAVFVVKFVVGDDWRAAAGVVALLATTALLAAVGLPAWPLALAATVAVLLWTVRRASAIQRNGG